MSSAGQKITQAHEHLGRAVGLLAFMLVRKRITRAQLDEVKRHLENALKIIQQIG